MTKTEYAEYLQSPHWQEVRKEAIESSNSICERCELPRWLAEIAYDQDLHVHHKSYRSRGKEQIEDLEVLCRRCHEVETFGRSELRAPKRAECEMCGDAHWDYRSDRCLSCRMPTGSPFFDAWVRGNLDGVIGSLANCELFSGIEAMKLLEEEISARRIVIAVMAKIGAIRG